MDEGLGSIAEILGGLPLELAAVLQPLSTTCKQHHWMHRLLAICVICSSNPQA